jgi:hypothetical protein
MKLLGMGGSFFFGNYSYQKKKKTNTKKSYKPQ